jgi:hypothetical protein
MLDWKKWHGVPVLAHAGSLQYACGQTADWRSCCQMPHLGPAKQVTCGSTIKLAHDSSKYRLHSQGIPYSRGSRQQSVTAFPLEHADSSSYWVVHGTKVRRGTARQQGTAERCLRSDLLLSNVSSGAAASGCHATPCMHTAGRDSRMEGLRVLRQPATPPAQDKPCRPGFPVNKRQQLRLQHVASRKWLHSHTYQSPLSGNQEVRPKSRNANDDRRIMKGRH